MLFMAIFQVDNYNITINESKDSLILIVVDNIKSITFTTIPINKSSDTYGNTSCENNVSLSLDMTLYDYLNNCLEGKENYSININHTDMNEESYLVIDFIFKFEMFKFNYSLNLELDE